MLTVRALPARSLRSSSKRLSRATYGRVLRVRSSNPSWAPSQDIIADDDKAKLDTLLARFKTADANGNGRIDRDELQSLLESTDGGMSVPLQRWLPEGEVERVLQQYDTDGSGDISYEEFTQLVYDGLLLEGQLAEYEEAFRAADTSQNGALSATELAHLLAELGQPVSYEKLVTIMQTYDIDSSGQIEFTEFLMMFRDHLLDLNKLRSWTRLGGQAPSSDVGSGSILEPSNGGVTVIFSEAELDELLARQADKPVLLFGALSWCRPCKAMQKPFQKMAQLYDKAVLVKLFGNANEHTTRLFKERLKIRSTPSFLLFKHGQLQASCSGANKERVEGLLRKFSSPDSLPPALYVPGKAPAVSAAQ